MQIAEQRGQILLLRIASIIENPTNILKNVKVRIGFQFCGIRIPKWPINTIKFSLNGTEIQ